MMMIRHQNNMLAACRRVLGIELITITHYGGGPIAPAPFKKQVLPVEQLLLY
jgi:hypothetical protein